MKMALFTRKRRRNQVVNVHRFYWLFSTLSARFIGWLELSIFCESTINLNLHNSTSSMDGAILSDRDNSYLRCSIKTLDNPRISSTNNESVLLQYLNTLTIDSRDIIGLFINHKLSRRFTDQHLNRSGSTQKSLSRTLTELSSGIQLSENRWILNELLII